MKRTPLTLALLLCSAPAVVQAETSAGQGEPWNFTVYVDGYWVPNEQAFLVPTVFADHGPLHLEARYNYEDIDTASMFVGWAFGFGKEEKYLKLTPMLGGAFGRTYGVAPGLEVEARWGRVAYWLETEYLFDLEDSSANYWYSWSELNVYAFPFLWLGGSFQRTKVVRTETEVSVGPMLGFGQPSRPGWSVSLYAYDLWTSKPWYLATVAIQL